MKNRIFQTIFLLTGILFFAFESAFAQQDTTKLKQEVEVTKAYRPELPAAVKINDIPKVVNEPTERPTFNYSIYSKPVFSTIEMAPVPAAKIVDEPKTELGMGLLKLGIGNYLTPYGEFFFNSKPDKNATFGMHFNHLSSSGKIKLLNNDKVKAPESANSAEIFGQKFFRSSTLTGTLAYDRKAFTYYGYTGDRLSDDEKAQMIPWFGDKQYLSKGTLSVDLKSDNHSAYDLSYNFSGNFHYLTTKTGQSESQTVFTGDLNKKYDKMYGILNASVTYYTADSIWNRITLMYGKKQQILIGINPSVKWAGDEASFQIGLNSTMVFDDDVDASFLVWPKVKVQWTPVPEILTLFAGVDGHLQHNTYSTIAYENPYVDPYHDIANTNFRYILSGGFKGRIGAKTNFVARASYSSLKDQHFYYLRSLDYYSSATTTLRRLNNTFDWLYSDAKVLKLSGEVLHSLSDKFSVHLVGDYYSYRLKSIDKPWQMPNFDMTFSGSYKPDDQLKFTAEIYLIGKRTALLSDDSSLLTPVSTQSHEIQIDPVIDLNAGVEYQFMKQFSFFAKINNFGFQKYEQWLGYTSKSLNWLAGISYSF